MIPTAPLILTVNGNLHIDPALNASVEFRPDGLHLLARQPVASAPIPATVPAAEPSAAPAAAPTQPPLVAAVEKPKVPQEGRNRRKKTTKRVGHPTRIEAHLNRVRAGEGPAAICLSSTIRPQSLFNTIAGNYYYHDKGGSPELWTEHYSKHKDEWDRIMAAGWAIPADFR